MVINRKKLLIVGASGLVGSNALAFFKKKKDWEVVGTYFSFSTLDTVFYDTLNPSNPNNFDISSFNPDYILHAGALTHVDYCEENPDESYQKTVTSTINLLKIAKECNAQFWYISTDYVFDGASGPYSEEDNTNPINVYGKHKLEAEELVKKELPHSHLIIRLTNVYGEEERNKNFISRIIQASQQNKGMNMKLPLDQYATPINAADIAKALFSLESIKAIGIFHLASTDYLNRIQLAQKVLDYFPCKNITTEAVITAELNQTAKRPLQGGLKASKFLSLFPYFGFSSVDEYLHTKIEKFKKGTF